MTLSVPLAVPQLRPSLLIDENGGDGGDGGVCFSCQISRFSRLLAVLALQKLPLSSPESKMPSLDHHHHGL
jgi:hypothetical protein